jgi:KDO2-lipid IV(A) lauroyltransferase
VSTRRSAREVLKAFQRGEVVGVLIDQNVDWYEAVFVNFFGRRAATNKGFALLVMKTGASVIPVFMIRDKDRFRVEVWPEVVLIKTGDKTKDIEMNTQLCNDVIERFVRRYPEQWFWVHQRWKTRPYTPWFRIK